MTGGLRERFDLSERRSDGVNPGTREQGYPRVQVRGPSGMDLEYGMDESCHTGRASRAAVEKGTEADPS